MTLQLKDITDDPEDLDRLSRFYEGLYIAGFPDPNERESLANMKRYLKRKREGWYGENHYHIILALEGERTVAASVSDYLAVPNCGIIEFLLVDETMRGSGLGGRLHAATLEAFNADARRAGRSGVDGIVIELNDPFRVAPQNDNYDPFERALIWDRWGYGRLCFPYVQPALSDEQEPVRCLLLGMLPIAPQYRREVPSSLVCDVLSGFMRWAMRIEKPETNAIFVEMKEFLDRSPQVQVEPLSVYVGRDRDRPLSIRPIKSANDPAFKVATDIYSGAFPAGPTVIDVRMFEHALRWAIDRKDLHYHLWALATGENEPITGMASFFVMPRFGFGGYLAFASPLRGSGRARILVKRVEEQIIRDEPEAVSHYIECLPNSSEEAVFLRLGFRRVPVRYIQPPTLDEEHFGADEGPEITLLAKHLGCDYALKPFSRDQVLQDLIGWLAGVYRLSDPEASETFRIARSTFGT